MEALPEMSSIIFQENNAIPKNLFNSEVFEGV